MSLLSSATVLGLVDSLAVAISQAYQLARVRLASAASPVLRMLVQRDHALGEVELLRRELAILRAQREQIPAHRRPEYSPPQRLAILQLKRLRGWNLQKTADHFVVHENTVRSWIKAVQSQGRSSLLAGAVVWNRIDDAVRWAVHELRRLCPHPEFGTRTLARHLIRAGIAISRSTVQRVVREEKPASPPRRPRPAMAEPAGKEPYHLLRPRCINRVWHIDLTQIRILGFRFAVAAILDGCSRKLLALRVYRRTPRSRHLTALVRRTVRQHGKPRFIISDQGTQFRKRFSAAMRRSGITAVRARVRAPFLNGKMERVFRTVRIWWRLVLAGLTQKSLQRRLDDFQSWYNEHRPHSALQGRTPAEAWQGECLPAPIPILARDAVSTHIQVRRYHCRGDPLLPVIQIILRRAA